MFEHEEILTPEILRAGEPRKIQPESVFSQPLHEALLVVQESASSPRFSETTFPRIAIPANRYWM